jgi:hypothetical protein
VVEQFDKIVGHRDETAAGHPVETPKPAGRP